LAFGTELIASIKLLIKDEQSVLRGVKTTTNMVRRLSEIAFYLASRICKDVVDLLL